MRRLLAGAAAAAVAAAGALVLGEYAFDGVAVVLAAALLGLFVAEAALAVARERNRPLALAVGAVTAIGLLWAGWIATGHRLGTVRGAGWAAVALGAVTATLRALPWRTPDRSRPTSAPAE
ncbi:MAG: hypothetical protein M3O23_02595 [Actinomycetota bacterium]|nr:hypothetical protein [Actinomycetota bacterium]